MYSAQLLDHFQDPRHAGEMPDADAVAEIENPVCGDVIRLSLRVADGRIVDARFRAKGCVPAIACASALTELIVGKMPRETLPMTWKDVADAVGGVPQASTHAAQLAVDVLAAALSRLR